MQGHISGCWDFGHILGRWRCTWAPISMSGGNRPAIMLLRRRLYISCASKGFSARTRDA